MPSNGLASAPTDKSFGPLSGECCALPGETLKGTLFFGGAGMDGAYIPLMIKALRSNGIHGAVYVDREKWSGGTGLDAAVGVLGAREFDPRFPMLLRNLPAHGDQFNLVGYSYGSLVAAQVAMKYANEGTPVDYLVLVGSPISRRFLDQLRNHGHIRNVLVINLDEHGDPILAGMSQIQLLSSLPTLVSQMSAGTGHFFYAPDTPEGQARRTRLAKALYAAGLR